MKSTPTPHAHTGVTTKELTVEFGPSGGTKYTVTVPAGTACIKLDGGSSPWVVQDLRFIAEKKDYCIRMRTTAVSALTKSRSATLLR